MIQEGLGRCKASLMPTSLFEAAATTYRRAEGSPHGRLSPPGRAVTNLNSKDGMSIPEGTGRGVLEDTICFTNTSLDLKAKPLLLLNIVPE